MRDQPTWRIPIGVLALLCLLGLYSLGVAACVAPYIAGWPALAQVPVYLLLGVVWLLPLGRFLVWMETGRWRRSARRNPPSGASDGT